MPVRSMRMRTSLMPILGSGTSSSQRPCSDFLFTRAFMISSLFGTIMSFVHYTRMISNIVNTSRLHCENCIARIFLEGILLCANDFGTGHCGGRRRGGSFCRNHVRGDCARGRSDCARKGTAIFVEGADFGRRTLQRDACVFRCARVRGAISPRWTSVDWAV